MVSITLSVSEEIREKMKEMSDINWSALVRKAITEEIKKRTIKANLLKDLQKEKDFSDWAVKLIRTGREKR